jgi:3-deoxy-manno-octulosonate cytidylyltransferase (CMP-KDO synthetase)
MIGEDAIFCPSEQVRSGGQERRACGRAKRRMTIRTLGVIPARLASTRLPRKLLREVAGKSLLAWTVEAARACPQFEAVVVAADSEEVAVVCREIGVPVVMTSPELPSGTDRMHAVSQVAPWGGYDIYVNVQGDEPFLRRNHIEALLRPFGRTDVDVTTLKVLCTPENVTNPNAVKVVTATDGRALYFSRATIPYDRDAALEQANPGRRAPEYWKHIGLYAYRRAALERFPTLPPSVLERTERLEQLRLLENGLHLQVEATEYDTVGVDTDADLLRAEEMLRSRAAAS